MRDELHQWGTDPCDTCPTGISKFRGFDGVRRCQLCITALVAERGWDKVKGSVPDVEPTPP